MIFLSNDVAYKRYWASNQGNCEEQVNFFHSEQLLAVDSNDVRFFAPKQHYKKLNAVTLGNRGGEQKLLSTYCKNS